MNVLGNHIAALRKEQGMTQDVLAGKLGVTFQAVSKWELGQSCPDITMLPELADVFGISIDALFGRAPLSCAPAAEQEAPREQVVYGELPWDDDRGTLHAVLFAGHKLVGNSLLGRYNREKQKVAFCYEGPALNIQSDFAVQITGGAPIEGSVNAGDSVTCGAVGGGVQAGDSVTCECVGGNVRAGDSVHCGDVGGSVSASDSVTCGNVGGDAQAGDGIRCGAIYGNATAGDGVRLTAYQK
ncbi:MAG: helix-turn-helix transcriptional regulator [Oscillospiraceae bacterium]|nr:helix-turn-helix transcriptional regulator [Oscillospiraceae bacterium]